MRCFLLLLLSASLGWMAPAAGGQNPAPRLTGKTIPAETATRARKRHNWVGERRKRIHIICHRGASEFAHENTLEAYRATFELGADGNEIDIRATKDGVLVCFHDDMLDHLLEAYGAVSEFTWDELRRFKFREPGPYGASCRIPTLVEVFELHRTQGGLLHLDIKRPGAGRADGGRPQLCRRQGVVLSVYRGGVGAGQRAIARRIRRAPSLTGNSVLAAAFNASACVPCRSSSWAMIASMRSRRGGFVAGRQGSGPAGRPRMPGAKPTARGRFV